MSDKLIGKTLDGRFILEEELGTGATGAVYKATQTAVDRVVAVKMLHAFLQERDDFKARFEIEAKAIARLNHPNCITLYDFGYDDEFDVFYMAVEYIEGQSLGDMLGEGNLAYEDVMAVSYQICEALEHAHREGILHRDLKPENIMISRSPNSGRLMVKVLDFGLARLYESKLEGGEETPTGRYTQLTQEGQVYGTPAYMSPEQCRAREELTAATDLYALGTMMFELFEGHLPFFSKSTAELILMQMTEEPPEMQRKDLPGDVRDIIHAMMQKDPEARPQSAKEVLLALIPHVRLDASQEFRIVPTDSGDFQIPTLEELTSPEPPPGLRPTPTLVGPELSNDELRVAQSKNSKMFAAVIAAIVLLGVGVAAFFIFNDPAADVEEGIDEPVAAVDGEAAGVADSEADGAEPAEDEEPVEVAESDKRKSTKKKRKGRRPATGKSDSSPKPASDRPKTLKLTY